MYGLSGLGGSLVFLYHSETGTGRARPLTCLLLPGAHNPPDPHKGSKWLHHLPGTIPRPLNCLPSLLGPINSHAVQISAWCTSWQTGLR